MLWSPEESSRVDRARRRVEVERARAVRAAEVADRHDWSAGTASDSMRPFHVRLAGLHRDIERRHRVAADIHQTYADRLAGWAATKSEAGAGAGAGPPRFMAAVASRLGVSSAGITLLGKDGAEVFAAASDSTTAAAQQAELGFGEGPAHDVTLGCEPLVAAVIAGSERWPYYAPVVSALGVRSVAAVPLRAEGFCVGALAVYDPESAEHAEPVESVVARLRSAADALAVSVLFGPDRDVLDLDSLRTEEFHDGGPGGFGLFEDTDALAVVHQAVGMLTEQTGRSSDDALALIRARAFAAGESVGTIARQILDRRLRLDASAREVADD